MSICKVVASCSLIVTTIWRLGILHFELRVMALTKNRSYKKENVCYTVMKTEVQIGLADSYAGVKIFTMPDII